MDESRKEFLAQVETRFAQHGVEVSPARYVEVVEQSIAQEKLTGVAADLIRQMALAIIDPDCRSRVQPIILGGVPA